jgi:hypothetical protein
MRYRVAAQCALAGTLLSVAPVATAAPARTENVTVQVGPQTRTSVVHVHPSYDGKRSLPC